MSAAWTRSRPAIACVLLAFVVACASDDDSGVRVPADDLVFSIAEGQSANHFIRGNGISAHLNLRAHPTPRLVVAFPAGNSGAAMWFAPVGDDPVWGDVRDLRVIERSDDAGRRLHGVQAEIVVEARALALANVDVGSVRFLRRAVDYARLPPREDPVLTINGARLRVSRERPDGQSAYLLDLEVLAGHLEAGPPLRLVADADGMLTIRVAAASGDPLEPPAAADHLVTENAADNDALENALAFLTYDTKLLAGSWRFLTYFGRDTLLTVQLLLPVLTAQTAEIGLASVLARINARGEVAHEEEIGELAVYRNFAARGVATAEPVYDYAMVDDNLLLAPVLWSYVETFGAERARAFLAGQTASAPLQSKLVDNLRLVSAQATPFAADPLRSNLLPIKHGFVHGNWRDSEEGLVGGRYAYDVNAVLMPAALRAAGEIVGSGLLGTYADSLPDREEWLRNAAVWEANAAGFFSVSLDSDEARKRLVAYAHENGYPLPPLPEETVRFDAVALDAQLEPIAVMHSDIGADLLFLRRPEAHLARIVADLTRQFPAGLATPIGVVAANPAFAEARAQALVTPDHYHGVVVWSWQQAMIVAGLDVQLRRDDLSDGLRATLLRAREQILKSIIASRQIINSELWSVDVRNQEFVIAPFGQRAGHLTESNAVQLWSTVFLALGRELPRR